MNHQVDNSFWFNCWENNNLGFNQETPNSTLINFFSTFSIPAKSCVFVPLCGKSIDMIWLLNQGLEIVGLELSPLAIQAFFEENNLLYSKRALGPFTLWEAKDRPITILEGDIFLLELKYLDELKLLKKSPFHFIYDRASLIALPSKIRAKYYKLYKTLMQSKSKALLLTIEYSSDNFEGPPFSVPEDEIISSLESEFNIHLLGKEKVKTLSPRFLESGLKEITQKAYRIEKC
ncbi:MAG: hypothetical protein CME68_03865 [Halobacteriovoraceae bacterium]|nr:hypothetical protein [Halobacteriovoraceae bacterium]|tara:strand:+ start:237 stop:935 length:699 start_codon:yes stop_codon:yes gene_type:complete